VLVLTTALAYGLTHFRRQFVWLYAYTAIIWVIFLFLLSVGLPIRGLLYITYPWSVPLLFLLSTCIQLYTNSLFKTKSQDWVYYVLYLMPVFSVVSAYGTVANPTLYQKNVAHLLAGEFLYVEHLLGALTSSLTYLTSFSMVHSILLIRRVREARFTGPGWLYWSLPWMQLILSVAGLFAIVVHVLGFASGQFMFTVLSMVSIALGTYVVLLSRYEERKLTSVISDAMFFAPSKHESIETFLRNLDGDAVRALFQEFTKPELASASLISSSDWDSFLHEPGGSLKSIGTSYWNSPNTGATNESGFSARPGGYRSYDGWFSSKSFYGYWWSSTENNTGDAWYRYLNYSNGLLGSSSVTKSRGFSVRCVCD
jgi:hypothetical protein